MELDELQLIWDKTRDGKELNELYFYACEEGFEYDLENNKWHKCGRINEKT